MRITIKLIIMLGIVSTPAVAENLFVGPSNQFATIQAAVNAALPGDRILVAEGEYTGAIIDKWVKISGVGEDTEIVNSIDGAFNAGFDIRSGADNTQISDLTISLSELGDSAFVTGIRVRPAGGPSATNGTIRNVKFIRLTRAVRARLVSGWIISDNIVDGMRAPPVGVIVAAGIWLSGSGNNLIAKNTINHVSAGGNQDQVYLGIQLSSETDGSVTSENNKVVGNTVSVDVEVARASDDLSLFDPVALNGGEILVFDNKIVQNDGILQLIPPELAEHNVIH